MKKNKVEFEETDFYAKIPFKTKDKWNRYFKLLYNERDVEHGAITQAEKDALLKSVGLTLSDAAECFEGIIPEWVTLINGFFRHYHSRIYTQFCVSMQHWDTLVAAQFRSTKDQKEISSQTDNLKRMKEVRELIDELEKDLYNNRHGDLGNIVTQKTFFKDTPVEDNAQKRSKAKKGPRDRAAEPYE